MNEHLRRQISIEICLALMAVSIRMYYPMHDLLGGLTSAAFIELTILVIFAAGRGLYVQLWPLPASTASVQQWTLPVSVAISRADRINRTSFWVCVRLLLGICLVGALLSLALGQYFFIVLAVLLPIPFIVFAYGIYIIGTWN